MDVITAVLSRRLPPVSSIRLDVPDCISRMIQMMTQKIINDRYQSASGVKYDLIQIQKFLGDGDTDKLNEFEITTRDVSSFFVLPTAMIGRQNEYDKV